MNTETAIALLALGLLTYSYTTPRLKAWWRRRRSLHCPTCLSPVLRPDWNRHPISCCASHNLRRQIKLAMDVMDRMKPPRLSPLPSLKRALSDPYHPHPGQWPSCPTCGHHLPALHPSPDFLFERPSSPAGTPAEGATPFSPGLSRSSPAKAAGTFTPTTRPARTTASANGTPRGGPTAAETSTTPGSKATTWQLESGVTEDSAPGVVDAPAL